MKLGDDTYRYVECADCGDSLVRASIPAYTLVEVAGNVAKIRVEAGSVVDGVEAHQCWFNLPPDADHLRLD